MFPLRLMFVFWFSSIFLNCFCSVTLKNYKKHVFWCFFEGTLTWSKAKNQKKTVFFGWVFGQILRRHVKTIHATKQKTWVFLFFHNSLTIDLSKKQKPWDFLVCSRSPQKKPKNLEENQKKQTLASDQTISEKFCFFVFFVFSVFFWFWFWFWFGGLWWGNCVVFFWFWFLGLVGTAICRSDAFWEDVFQKICIVIDVFWQTIGRWDFF